MIKSSFRRMLCLINFTSSFAAQALAEEWRKSDTPQEGEFSYLYFTFDQFYTISSGRIFHKETQQRQWPRRQLTTSGNVTSLHLTKAKLFTLRDDGHLSVTEDGASWRAIQIPAPDGTSLDDLTWGNGHYPFTST
ncbi:MAG: hypothetical protein ACJAVK_002985 [Akkermansiaceae bacterium]|jgi:hypothetical protein